MLAANFKSSESTTFDAKARVFFFFLFAPVDESLTVKNCFFFIPLELLEQPLEEVVRT